mmetsp:Transcript_80907/g.216967  ORF Transcript_80907/g.216967 Transcript_80907/m.216967 type:complete len:958 (+) Transcript_80907:1525-4398(+)
MGSESELPPPQPSVFLESLYVAPPPFHLKPRHPSGSSREVDFDLAAIQVRPQVLHVAKNSLAVIQLFDIGLDLRLDLGVLSSIENVLGVLRAKTRPECHLLLKALTQLPGDDGIFLPFVSFLGEGTGRIASVEQHPATTCQITRNLGKRADLLNELDRAEPEWDLVLGHLSPKQHVLHRKHNVGQGLGLGQSRLGVHGEQRLDGIGHAVATVAQVAGSGIVVDRAVQLLTAHEIVLLESSRQSLDNLRHIRCPLKMVVHLVVLLGPHVRGSIGVLPAKRKSVPSVPVIVEIGLGNLREDSVHLVVRHTHHVGQQEVGLHLEKVPACPDKWATGIGQTVMVAPCNHPHVYILDVAGQDRVKAAKQEYQRRDIAPAVGKHRPRMGREGLQRLRLEGHTKRREPEDVLAAVVLGLSGVESVRHPRAPEHREPEIIVVELLELNRRSHGGEMKVELLPQLALEGEHQVLGSLKHHLGDDVLWSALNRLVSVQRNIVPVHRPTNAAHPLPQGRQRRWDGLHHRDLANPAGSLHKPQVHDKPQVRERQARLGDVGGKEDPGRPEILELHRAVLLGVERLGVDMLVGEPLDSVHNLSLRRQKAQQLLVARQHPMEAGDHLHEVVLLEQHATDAAGRGARLVRVVGGRLVLALDLLLQVANADPREPEGLDNLLIKRCRREDHLGHLARLLLPARKQRNARVDLHAPLVHLVDDNHIVNTSASHPQPGPQQTVRDEDDGRGAVFALPRHGEAAHGRAVKLLDLVLNALGREPARLRHRNLLEALARREQQERHEGGLPAARCRAHDGHVKLLDGSEQALGSMRVEREVPARADGVDAVVSQQRGQGKLSSGEVDDSGRECLESSSLLADQARRSLIPQERLQGRHSQLRGVRTAKPESGAPSTKIFRHSRCRLTGLIKNVSCKLEHVALDHLVESFKVLLFLLFPRLGHQLQKILAHGDDGVARE